MNQTTAIRMLKLAGVALIVAGLLLIVNFGNMDYIGPIFIVVGTITIIFGLLWIWKVDKAARRRLIASKARAATRSVKRALVVFLLLSSALSPMLSVAHLQTINPECDPTGMCMLTRARVLWVEYAIIGLLIVAGFLAFGPIILGRTILGAILAELQYIAGAMLLLIMFLFLLVVPIDVMFEVFDYGGQPCCRVNMDNLRTRGPPILQAILRLIYPSIMPPESLR